MELKTKLNLLIGCTGALISKKVGQLALAFQKTNKFNIRVILTKPAKLFSDEYIGNYDKFGKENGVEFYFSNDEFTYYEKDRSRTLHIEMRRWADLLILAPLTANTLAKITNGLCDNLLTCVIRAWDFNKKIFFCLSMNDLMYDHFMTQKQIQILVDEFKFVEIPSERKNLGQFSMIFMPNIETVVDIVVKSCKDFKRVDKEDAN